MADMVILRTIQYVPVELRSRPIFIKVSAILDFITLTNHYDNVAEMAEQFDIQGASYDPTIVSSEFGATQIKSILTAAGAAIDDRSLVGLARMVYRLKGTSRGLVFLLKLLGLQATVYEGNRVQREIALQTADGVKWAEDAELSVLGNCEILIGLTSEVSNSTDTLTEDQLLLLAQEFMWVCSNIIGFKVGTYITNDVFFTQDVEHQINEDIRQPFRVGKMRDLPYPPFDIGGFFIGEGAPLPYPYPTIGSHHKNKPLNALDGFYDTYDTEVDNDWSEDIGTPESDANSSEMDMDSAENFATQSLLADFEVDDFFTTGVDCASTSNSDLEDDSLSGTVTDAGRNGRGIPLIGGFYIGNPVTNQKAKYVGGSRVHISERITYEWVS